MKTEYPMAQKKYEDLIKLADRLIMKRNEILRQYTPLSEEVRTANKEYNKIKNRLKIEYGIEHY